MRIEGCTKGNHLFVGAKKNEVSRSMYSAVRRELTMKDVEERVTCRLDHYQTPTQVHVSAFAKG